MKYLLPGEVFFKNYWNNTINSKKCFVDFFGICHFKNFLLAYLLKGKDKMIKSNLLKNWMCLL
jgi:hypothetical protein